MAAVLVPASVATEQQSGTDHPSQPVAIESSVPGGRPSDVALKEVAFQEFYTSQHQRLFSMGLVLTGGNLAEAEDLLQEVMLRIWRYWDKGQIRDPARLARKMLVSVSHSRLRRRAGDAELLASEAQLLADEINEVPSITGYEDRTELLHAIQALPPQQRAVVVLHSQGLTVREVAEVLGLAPSRVRTLSHRALAQLREQLSSRDH